MRRAMMIVTCLSALAVIGGDAGTGPPAAGKRANAWNSDIVVVTVTRVLDERPTNGRPPRVTIEVNEVIQGDPKKERTPALWTPTSGGHFDPESVYTQPELKKKYDEWSLLPMDPPEVGSKWIVFGRVLEHQGKPIFRLDDRERHEYTREKHDEIAKVLRDARERLEADRKAFAAARAKWRAAVTDVDIRKYVEEADFVGVGNVSVATVWSGGGEHIAYVQVTEVLKGVPRYTEQPEKGVYALTVPLEGRVAQMISWPSGSYLTAKEPHVVFVSEDGAEIQFGGSGMRYTRIKAREGIVIADEAALRAAREAAQQPRKGQDRPLVVYHASVAPNFPAMNEGYATLYPVARRTIVKAAEGRAKLVNSTHVAQWDSATEAARIAKVLKGTDYVVSWSYEKGDEKTQRVRFEVARVRDDSVDVIVRRNWPLESEEELLRHATLAFDDVLGKPAATKK